MAEFFHLPRSVEYDQVKDVLEKGGALVVDVRETRELEKKGHIPGSINIPLSSLEEALQLENAEFMEKYQVEKPEKTSPIVFTCSVGVRSAKAIETASNLGYTYLSDYSGGFEDFKEKSPVKPPLPVISITQSIDEASPTIIDYNTVKNIIEEKSGTVIDLREPREISKTGNFAGTFNIPFSVLKESLEMDSEMFFQKFKFKKPEIGDEIIFSCMRGIRSNKAVGIGRELGFAHLSDYSGGFQDWRENKLEEERAKAANSSQSNSSRNSINQESVRPLGKQFRRGN